MFQWTVSNQEKVKKKRVCEKFFSVLKEEEEEKKSWIMFWVDIVGYLEFFFHLSDVFIHISMIYPCINNINISHNYYVWLSLAHLALASCLCSQHTPFEKIKGVKALSLSSTVNLLNERREKRHRLYVTLLYEESEKKPTKSPTKQSNDDAFE